MGDTLGVRVLAGAAAAAVEEEAALVLLVDREVMVSVDDGRADGRVGRVWSGDLLPGISKLLAGKGCGVGNSSLRMLQLKKPISPPPLLGAGPVRRRPSRGTVQQQHAPFSRKSLPGAPATFEPTLR